MIFANARLWDCGCRRMTRKVMLDALLFFCLYFAHELTGKLHNYENYWKRCVQIFGKGEKIDIQI